MRLKYKYNNTWEEIPNFKVLISDLPLYAGEYTITPNTYNDDILITKNKKLEDNITVKKIPQFEVSNDNGYTLIIGEESLNG